MKKIIALFVMLAGFGIARAQNETSTASQTTNLALSNAIEVSFAANGSNTGAALNFNFTSVNDYANGMESAPVQMRVKSNKKFNLAVKSNSAYFTYSGTTSPAPQMYVGTTLWFKMIQNNTGGWTYVNNTYDYIDHYNWTFLYNGNNGGDQNFTLVYKVKPGFAFPAGNYTTDVIYTATQQ